MSSAAATGNPRVDFLSPLAACRWALVPPDAASSGGWEMEVRASRDIAAGEELLLSYGERRCTPCQASITHCSIMASEI